MKILSAIAWLAATCLSVGVAGATTVPVGLPGYLKDSMPLPGDTAQKVLASLREQPGGWVQLQLHERGVATIQFSDDPTETLYVIYGKGHWAYPSVMRLRRSNDQGFWATRMAYLCGADERACERFRKLVEAHEDQVTFVDSDMLRRDDLKALWKPLPTPAYGPAPPKPDKNFWISVIGLAPDYAEHQRMDEASTVLGRQDCGGPAVYGIPPTYPTTALVNEIGGTAVLVVTIGDKGNVERVAIEKSSHNRSLDKAALSAVALFRFDMSKCPADSESVIRIPFEFKPAGPPPLVPLATFDAAPLGFPAIEANGK
jgi:TonB family protein